MNDDSRLAILGQFTPEGTLTPGYGDHYLFMVGRDDCHGILHYLISAERLQFKLNMFGFDDDELNTDIMTLMSTPSAHFPGVIWSEFTLTAKQRDGIVSWATSHIGTPYSWADDVAIGIEKILHERTPKRILRRLSSTRTMQCAQLADAAYAYGAGIQIFDDHRYFGCVFPGSYVPIFEARGWM